MVIKVNSAVSNIVLTTGRQVNSFLMFTTGAKYFVVA